MQNSSIQISFSFEEETLLKSIRRYKWKTLLVMIYSATYFTFFYLIRKSEREEEQDPGGNNMFLYISTYFLEIFVN